MIVAPFPQDEDARLASLRARGAGGVAAGAGLRLAEVDVGSSSAAGWCWVEDNRPRGVAFCLRLPLRPAPAAPELGASSA